MANIPTTWITATTQTHYNKSETNNFTIKVWPPNISTTTKWNRKKMIHKTKTLVLSRCLWGSGENCWQVVDCVLIIQCPQQGCMLPGLGQWIISVLSSVHQFDSFSSARASLSSLSMSAGQRSQSEFRCCGCCYGGCCCFQAWLKAGCTAMRYASG